MPFSANNSDGREPLGIPFYLMAGNGLYTLRIFSKCSQNQCLAIVSAGRGAITTRKGIIRDPACFACHLATVGLLRPTPDAVAAG